MFFGDENMLVKSFSREDMFKNDLLSDFFNSIGFSMIGKKVSNINKTPDIYVTELLRHINENLEIPRYYRIFLNEMLAETINFSNRKYYFSFESRLKFLEKYSDLISEIDNRFSNGKSFFSMPSADDNQKIDFDILPSLEEVHADFSQNCIYNKQYIKDET